MVFVKVTITFDPTGTRRSLNFGMFMDRLLASRVGHLSRILRGAKAQIRYGGMLIKESNDAAYSTAVSSIHKSIDKRR